MEIVCCQLVAAIGLRDFGCQGFRKTSSICHGAKQSRDCVNNLSFRVRSGETVDSVRERAGASREFRVRVDARAVRSRGNGQLDVEEQLKLCVRCGTTYRDEDNSPVACKYHGHMTGDPGLYSLAPPHQGIDGEWSDASGVIVYKWNVENERPNTGSKNWKRRWTCCGVYAEDGAPCHSGRHVSYDDGATRF